MLRFLGRGSAFADEQNSAFFTCGNDLVLIDLAMSDFHKVKRFDLDTMFDKPIETVYVLVTHTHSDHCGGIPMLIHLAFYVWHKPVVVVAPNEEIASDLEYLIDRLDGCDRNGYTLITSGLLNKEWFVEVVPTDHSPSLKGRCFGYRLKVGGTPVIYTGDTCTLEPFKPYIMPGTILYTEAAAIDSGVHIFLKDHLPYLTEQAAAGTAVYLMHLDNEESIAQMIEGTDIQLAPLYNVQV